MEKLKNKYKTVGVKVEKSEFMDGFNTTKLDKITVRQRLHV